MQQEEKEKHITVSTSNYNDRKWHRSYLEMCSFLFDTPPPLKCTES